MRDLAQVFRSALTRQRYYGDDSRGKKDKNRRTAQIIFCARRAGGDILFGIILRMYFLNGCENHECYIFSQVLIKE